MNPSTARGNDPARWEKLLAALDEKLQLGLLDHLSRVSSYHFEGDVLYIEPGSTSDAQYLKRETVFQQLELLAQDAIRIDKLKIKAVEEE